MSSHFYLEMLNSMVKSNCFQMMTQKVIQLVQNQLMYQ